MKKLIYCALALVTALFASSCMQESLEPNQDGATVTFTVKVPELVTKAIGDGNNVNNLVYAVYRVTGETEEYAKANLSPEKLVYQAREDVSQGNATVSLELTNDQAFLVLFWAQVDNVWFANDYKFGTEKVTYPSELVANNDKYSAFYGVSYVSDVTGPTTKDITLTRPFAQINIATTDPESYDVDIKSSSVTIANAGDRFNVATEVAEGTTDVTYAEAKNPEGTFNDYVHYVAMNYAFVSGTVDVTYNINTASHGTINHTVLNVPVVKNYRTNIIGNLLTSDVKYNVELDQDWGPAGEEDDDINMSVVTAATVQEIEEAIEEAVAGKVTNIKLEVAPNSQGQKVIDLTELGASLMSTKAGENDYGLLIPYGKSIVLDLNGCTITQTKEQTTGYAMIKVEGDLTIVDSEGNGVISYTDSGNGGEYVSNTIYNLGTLIVKSGKIINNSLENVANNGYPYAVDSGVWGQAAEVITNIEGGELWSNYSPLRVRADRADKKVETNVSGGKFYGRIDFQHSSNSGAIGILNISGGEFNANGIIKDKSMMIFGGCGLNSDASKMVLNITGGKFDAEIIKNTTIVPIGSNFNDKFIKGGEFKFDPSEFVADGYPVSKNGDYYTIGEYTPVAKIGNVEYGSLISAVKAVKDGDVITLIANETFTKQNRTHNSGTWYDGLYYVGDKDFTIDLGGFTISQDGNVNDYLLNFKNSGFKENTITIKNGTIDAGTAAYCAICTSSSQDNLLTINTEGVNIINNISNGSTIKLRGGAVLNLGDGTVITGKDSYLGIECVGSTVNINDGVEIYMNGKTSYNGCLVGVCYGGVVNVYGGYGKGVKGGFIAMTSGGTINIYGGEWIANTDGTVGDNSNFYVLTAQSNKYESGFVGAAIINVMGGTFHGGMDAWVLNNLPEEKAELNISGGNFNADPTRYLTTGSFVKPNTTYEVLNGVVAATAEQLIDGMKAADANATIYITADITISEKWDNRYTGAKFTKPVVIDGLGHTIKFTGEVNDGSNFSSAFRFEAGAIVKNLTIDMSEATSGWRLSAISTKSALTVDNCKFIGNANAWRAVIFGEAAGQALDFTVSVSNCEFATWKYGIQDNANAQDIKSVSIENNKFTNAKVNVSAREFIRFCGNETDSEVKITSYNSASTAKVVAIGNIMNAALDNTIGGVNKKFNAANVEAQDEFKVFTE